MTLAAGMVAMTSIGINVVLAVVLKTSQRQNPHYRPLRTTHRSSSSRNSFSDKDMAELLPLHDGAEESSLVDSSDEIDEETSLCQQRFSLPQVSASR